MNAPKTTASQSEALWRKGILISGGALLLCCFSALCYFGLLFYVVDQDIALIPSPPLNPNCTETACLNACIRQLPDFDSPPLVLNGIELLEKDGGVEIVSYRVVEDTNQIKLLDKPAVAEYLIPYQDNESLHHLIWEYYTSVFPTMAEMHVSYVVFSINNRADGFSAAVDEQDGKWWLFINLFAFDSAFAVTDTLAHEFGHILTLNKTQAVNLPNDYGENIDREGFDSMRHRCNGRFFSGWRCAINDSYLHVFGNRFWRGQLYEDWVTAFLESDEEEIVYRAAFDEFYTKYTDQFVSTYAATNPHEDIAESWTEFLLRPKPEGTTIADEKVLFFYEYPELVQMRRDILQAVCQFAIEQK